MSRRSGHELSSWNHDVSFSAMSWQGLFVSLIKHDPIYQKKNAYFHDPVIPDDDMMQCTRGLPATTSAIGCTSGNAGRAQARRAGIYSGLAGHNDSVAQLKPNVNISPTSPFSHSRNPDQHLVDESDLILGPAICVRRDLYRSRF